MNTTRPVITAPADRATTPGTTTMKITTDRSTATTEQADLKGILDTVEQGGGILIVSGCLAGINCRYDGGNCLNESVRKLVDEGKAITVCPEQLGDLPIPRIPSEIVGGDGRDVLAGNAKVMTKTGEDVTRFFVAGAETALNMATGAHVLMAVLKARSPSCGYGAIYDGSFTGGTREGKGIAAAMLENAGITVINEETWRRLSYNQ